MIEYMAGVFDAEGYVRIRKTTHTVSGRSHYIPEVKIYMCDERIIKLFSDRYNVPIKTELRGNNKKRVYFCSLGIQKLRTESFIADMLPLLNEKGLLLKRVQEILDPNIIDNEAIYQKYLTHRKTYNHPLINTTSIRYIAGQIDGDGWLSVGKRGTSHFLTFRVGIEQRYEPFVKFMADMNNGSVTKRDGRKSNHHDTYTWYSSKSSILPFLISIEPFLIEKKERCNKLIQYIESYEKTRIEAKNLVDWWKQNV